MFIGQATAETVDLTPPHAPKSEAIKSFKELEHELKRELIHLRHDHDKHEKEYFQAVVSFFLVSLPRARRESRWYLSEQGKAHILSRPT